MSALLRARRGGALITALLGLLLLEAAIAGLLVVCTQEALIASASTQRLRARIAAASAVNEAIARWPADTLRLLAPGGVHHVPGSTALAGGATFSADIERLHGSWFLVRGQGRGGGVSASSARAGALVWTADPAAFWREFDAPVVTEADVTIGAGAQIDGTRPTHVPPPWSAVTCPAQAAVSAASALGPLGRPAIVAAPSANVAIDPAAALAGTPPVHVDSGRTTLAARRVAGIELDALASLADHVHSGSMQLAPVSAGGACDATAAGNAGDPFDPSSPCADHHALIYAPGDLEITAGEGQGVLVVRGRLRLANGVRFVGAILAEGGITAEGATVLGAVRTASASSIQGVLSWNACALWRALTLTPALRRPYRRSTRWWLPAF